jgi:hypothetical protein
MIVGGQFGHALSEKPNAIIIKRTHKKQLKYLNKEFNTNKNVKLNFNTEINCRKQGWAPYEVNKINRIRMSVT